VLRSEGLFFTISEFRVEELVLKVQGVWFMVQSVGVRG
jgi:hypothetical protein